MYFYSDEEKKLLGRYFRYLRKERKVPIKIIKNTLSFSYPTYHDIEKGVSKKDDELYDEIIKMYFVKYTLNNKIYKLLNQNIENLYKAVERFDKITIHNFINVFFEDYDNYKNDALFKELFITLKIIKKYYINNQYHTIEEIINVIPLIQLWHNHLSSILIEICEFSNLNVHYSTKTSHLLFENIEIIDSISTYWYARECVMHMKYSEAINMFYDLNKYYEEQKNLERKARVMIQEFCIYRDIDYDKAIIFSKDLTQIVQKENLSNTVKENISYVLAMFYYLHQYYREALDFFEKTFSINNNPLYLIYIYACKSRLKIYIEFDERVDKKFSLYHYLYFYKLKSMQVNDKKLEEYIMVDLMKYLLQEKYEQPFWNMFEYELRQIVLITRNYKNLQKYRENFEFATKTVF